jgi:hypothetical protein
MDAPGVNAGCRKVIMTCPAGPTASPMKSSVPPAFGSAGTENSLMLPICENCSSRAPFTASPTTWIDPLPPPKKLTQTVPPPSMPGPVAIAG